jgi:hypothetical protein
MEMFAAFTSCALAKWPSMTREALSKEMRVFMVEKKRVVRDK